MTAPTDAQRFSNRSSSAVAANSGSVSTGAQNSAIINGRTRVGTVTPLAGPDRQFRSTAINPSIRAAATVRPALGGCAGKLNTRELWNIVNDLRSLAPKPTRAR